MSARRLTLTTLVSQRVLGGAEVVAVPEAVRQGVGPSRAPSPRPLALVRLIAIIASIAVAMVVMPASAALATLSHEYLSRFNEIPTEGPSHEPIALPGPVSTLGSMTVDSGHVWIAEQNAIGPTESATNTFRVDEFNGSTGGFLAQPLHSSEEGSGASYHVADEYLGVAVGHLAGEPEPQLYVAEYDSEEGGPHVGVYSTSGVKEARWSGAQTPAGSFGVVFRVGVDNSSGSLTDWAEGDVYVPVPGQQVVDVFKPQAGGAEKYVTQLTGTCATPTSCTEDKFNNLYEVAVSGANGDVLVTDGSVVDMFEPTVLGEYAFVRQLTGTPAGSFEHVHAVAVDSSTGDVFVVDGSNEKGGAVVDQFSSEGVYRGHLTGTPEGPFQIPYPPNLRRYGGHISTVGMDPENHHVYIADAEQEEEGVAGQRHSFVDIFGPSIVVPDVTTDPASEIEARSTTLNGTVNPAAAGAATCHFDYGTTTHFGSEVPCSEAVAEGESPVSVHALLGNLKPDTTYFYRLQASNANGKNLGEFSQNQQFTTAGPGIHDEGFASAVTSSSATLNATVDPHGAPTSYYFQYGTSASYGTSVPLAPGASLGSGEGDLSASVHLQGLAPATTYHYRVVVIGEPSGEVVTIEGADRTFTTQAVGGQFALPDGRVWEMVTPPDKQGAGLVPLGETDIQASADGGGLTFDATAPFVVDPAGSHSPNYTQVLSRRLVPGSWESQDIATPAHEGATGGPDAIPHEYRFFSSDLSLGLVEPYGHYPIPPLPAGSGKTLYLRDSATGEYGALLPAVEAVLPGAEFEDGGSYGPFIPVGVSADLSEVAVEPTVALKNAPSAAGLYVWSKGRLLPVSELPNGGIIGKAIFVQFSHDDSRILMSINAHLYLRDLLRRESISIEAPHEGAGAAGRSIENIFFASPMPLTPGASKNNLYAFEVTSGSGEPLAGRLTDVTAPQSPGEEPGVRGVVGSSEDGSYVYFDANGVLGNGAERGALAGVANVYVEHYDAGAKAWGKPSFVTRTGKTEDAHVSTNGRYMVFESSAPGFGGYDNRDARTGAPDAELFQYDAVSDRVVCVSCDPTGARPAGPSSISGVEPINDTLQYGIVPHNGYYTPRYLSNEGRLFFDSRDALVPADVNGREDVYEFEPAGVGSCQGAGHGQSASIVFNESIGGCVGLISTGTSSEDSSFMDASESGGDVFFMTLSRLAPQDQDTSMDVYDAHLCSASAPCAAQPPASVPPCVTGDACKVAPSPQPAAFGSPASATFSGAGNVTPAPEPKPTSRSRKVVKCKRGKVRRNGRCVKKKAKRASRPARRGR